MSTIKQIIAQAESDLSQLVGEEISLLIILDTPSKMRFYKEQFARPNKSEFEMLKELTAEVFRINVDALHNKEWDRTLTDARTTICYIATKHLGMHRKQLAQELQKNDSQILKFIKKAKDMIAINDGLKHKIELIERQLLNHL